MRVDSYVGVPPETLAFAMAKYSRSSQSMGESINEISADKASKFLETFYFQYGHKSIADLAHLAFGIEDISILAAVELEDETLWDGQDRSTRYQDFRKSGWVVPLELVDHESESIYNSCMQMLFDAYFRLSEVCFQILLDLHPCPPVSSEAELRSHNRTLHARAFDVARYLLPLGTKTSVGQIVSARVLERQISRLLTSSLSEVRQLGLSLRDAAIQPSSTPSCIYPEPVSAAPTLVKYPRTLEYELDLRSYFTTLAGSIHLDRDEMDNERVRDVVCTQIQNEILATYLYRYDPQSRPLHKWYGYVVWEMTVEDINTYLNVVFRSRGKYDELSREFRAGLPFVFDLCIDIGAYRDFHRHRRCVQVRQDFSFDLGYEDPEKTVYMGLGSGSENRPRFHEAHQILETTFDAIKERAKDFPQGVQKYLLPLGYRTRCLFKMDLAEACYITELRTGVTGHFSYRQIAWEMFNCLPDWTIKGIRDRVTDPTQVVDLTKR